MFLFKTVASSPKIPHTIIVCSSLEITADVHIIRGHKISRLYLIVLLMQVTRLLQFDQLANVCNLARGSLTLP